MRDWRATLLIASAIPICLLATFTALHMTGHSLNVISLAGLAFAVGMVVEGAIVVSGKYPAPEGRRHDAARGRVQGHATGRAAR